MLVQACSDAHTIADFWKAGIEVYNSYQLSM